MKKLVMLTFISLMAGGLLSSCSKTTKGKISGDWNVDYYAVEYKSQDYLNESSETEIEEWRGKNYTYKHIDIDGTVHTLQGTVKDARLSIKKEGTWERILDYQVVDGNSIETYYITQSGTWDFLSGKGTGDFKKNERIILNITKIKEGSDEYEIPKGEISGTFIITESKKSLLKMEIEEGYRYLSKGNSGSGFTVNGQGKRVTNEYFELSK
ncbi:MAG: hypothetical protein WC994_06035 [Brumimicrobium sp.]